MSFRPIFKDLEKNNDLKEKGYAIVPFLNQDEVNSLKHFFLDNHHHLPEGMYASSHSPDFDLRKKMNEKIQSGIKRASDNTFKDVRVLGGTFMVKSKGQNSSLHPHQDWNIVDESEFNSYNIWLPLVDTSSENGTLLILPNSHVLFENIRGLNIPSSFKDVANEVWKYLKPISMKAGEALVYDHRLLHASDENKTEEPRLVIVNGLVSIDAEMRYYYGRDNSIETYACTPEFYFNHDINNGPEDLQLLNKQDNTNLYMQLSDLQKVYESPEKSIVQRLLAYFK